MEVEHDVSAPIKGGAPKQKSKCVLWWKEVDALIIKPLLLHNYNKELHKKK